MSKHVFSEPQEYLFAKDGHTGKKFDIASLTNKVEVLLIETHKGHEQTLKENECDFLYYILNGSGSFIIDDQEEACQQGDLVVIPSGSTFTFKGNLKMLLFVTPPFSPDQEEIIK